MTKDNFVMVLKDIGLSEDQMEKFHAVLEERHPKAHQELLEWLNIPAAEVTRLRNTSK